MTDTAPTGYLGGRRWPLAPVLAQTGHTQTSLARTLGVGQGSLVHPDGISDLIADRVATRLGCHPLDFWPDWLDAALAEEAAERTSCDRGHDWTNPDNLRIRPDGSRRCAECCRDGQRARRAAKRAA